MKRFLVLLSKVVLFFIGWAVCSAMIDIPIEDPSLWRFTAELFPMLSVILFTVVFWLIDKKKVSIPVFRNCIQGSLTGSVAGIVWIGSATVLLVVLNAETITGHNHVPRLWLWIISAFLNTVMQEFLVRGYLYQAVKAEYGLIPAMLFTTALFTFCHGGALEAGIVPVFNIITMSLFATAIYEYTGTILSPIFAHAIWNIVGGILLGGVSLADDYPHLFHMEASGNVLLSGGAYMIEGSAAVLVINILLFIFFIVKRHRKSRHVPTREITA